MASNIISLNSPKVNDDFGGLDKEKQPAIVVAGLDDAEEEKEKRSNMDVSGTLVEPSVVVDDDEEETIVNSTVADPTIVVAGLDDFEEEKQPKTNVNRAVTEPTNLRISLADGDTASFKVRDTQSVIVDRESLQEVRAINKTIQEEDRRAKDIAKRARNESARSTKKERKVFPTEKFRPHRANAPGADSLPPSAFGISSSSGVNVAPNRAEPSEVSVSSASQANVAPDQAEPLEVGNSSTSQAEFAPDQAGPLEVGISSTSQANVGPDQAEHDHLAFSGFLAEATVVPDLEEPPEPIIVGEELRATPGLVAFLAFLKTSRGIMICCGIVIALAGVAVTGILCGGGGCTSSDSDPGAGPPQVQSTSSNNNNNNNSNRPGAEVSPITPAPSGYVSSKPEAAPTPAPTTAPSTVPTPAPSGNVLWDILPDATLLALEDPFQATPQSKAFSWLENHPLLNSLADWRKQELFALATFYFAFNGDKWWESERTNYLSYIEPSCNWGGEGRITCSSNGRLRSLGLGGSSSDSTMPLAGFMPPEIALLSWLEKITIYHTGLETALSNMILTEMGLMTSLRELHYYDNRLSGTIPTEISMLKSLQRLSISRCNLAGTTLPSTLGLFTELTYLRLSKNEISGTIPTELGLLTSQEEFWLEGNQLEGSLPTELGLLTSLSYLFLHENKIAGTLPTVLGLMNSLEKLSLGWNYFSGAIPTELGLVSPLEYIQVQYNDLSGTVPDEVCSLSKVSKLLVDCGSDKLTCPAECGCQCCPDDSDCLAIWV